VKSGTTNPGAEVSVTGGSRDYSQPAFSYGGRTGAIDYFAAGQYIHNGLGIENPTRRSRRSTTTPTSGTAGQGHGHRRRQYAARFHRGRCELGLPDSNVPFQTAAFAVNGQTDFNSAILDQRQWNRAISPSLAAEELAGPRLPALGLCPLFQAVLPARSSGDLAFNGIAPWTQRTSFATGCRATAPGRPSTSIRCARLPGPARASHRQHQGNTRCRS